MKITFIRPCIGRVKPEQPERATVEPLSIAVLSAITPADIERSFYDDRVENIPFDEPTDFVVITVETFTAKRAWEIAAKYQNRNIPVIAGGIHVTLIPDEAAQHVDSICLYDGEYVWPEIIDDMRKGKLKPRYLGKNSAPQAGFLPDREIFKGKKYLPLKLVQFSRGCPWDCSFCGPAVYFNRKHYHRRIDEVVREISTQKLKTVLFVDDNITANQKQAIELFRELIPLKIRWGSQASIEMTSNPLLMDTMARSGCVGHVLGVESTVSENLKSMNKIPNLNNSLDVALSIFRDYGFQSWAALTVGHEYDTPETIANTIEYIIEKKFAFAAVNMLVPYPGTRFYKMLSDEGRLLYDGNWWLHPDYRMNRASFVPAKMTPEELSNACAAGWERFFSHSSILTRFLDRETNLSSVFRAGIYLIYNYIFRWEYYRTDRLKFGLEVSGS